jgi:hypothetical protein
MNDKLGRPLEVGDEVIFATGNRTTRIGKVKSFGKKMVVIKCDPSSGSTWSPEFNRYPDEILKTGSSASEVETIPADIGQTLYFALRLVDGQIATTKLEAAAKWLDGKF